MYQEELLLPMLLKIQNQDLYLQVVAYFAQLLNKAKAQLKVMNSKSIMGILYD
jgi:hypothetical protein